MAISLEFYNEDEEYKQISQHKFQIVHGYFNFELNDIDLNKIWRVLREGRFSQLLQNHTIIPETSLLISYNPQEYLGKHELIEKIVYEDFNEIYSKISDSFLNINSYPYYKNTIFDELKNKIYSYKEDKYKQIYFLTLLLSKRKIIIKKIKEFYKKKFSSNFQNSSGTVLNNNTIGDLLSYFSDCKNKRNDLKHQIERDTTDVTNTINLDILKSDKFKEFSASLSQWYSLAEVITLNLGLLNDYFGFKLEFEQDKFSLHNNFGFSLETFAKKNILKLISYCLKKMTFDVVNFKEFNYKRLMLIFASTFTCGISLKDFIFNDVKQFALMVFYK